MGEGGRDDPEGRRNAPAPAPPSTTLSPSAEFPALSDEEVAALRRIGQRWGPPGQPKSSRELPVDPALGRYPSAPAPRGFNRLTRVEMFRAEKPGELVAEEPAFQPESRLGRALIRARRILLGPPLASAAVLYERMPKIVALPVLASDLLSSVAYGPEAMLTVLAVAGTSALGLSLPIAACLVVLMIAVGISYRQTIPAYPHGAGSYIVASDNLGARPGLAAAAGLMMDYILTVSVSVAAGVTAITSALPGLRPFTVPLGLLVIAALLAGNLRGIRAAGNLFAAPTYVFVAALGLLILVGLARAAGRGFAPVPPPPTPAMQGVGLLLVLRAFASGATSMTGIEAVSNAVPVFRPVEWRNARITLTWMIVLLVTLFAGLVVLFRLNGLVPMPDQTMLSQLAHRTFPTGPWYAVIQAATAIILLLAANTAFNDFPRLLFFMARDGHAPRRFLHMGDRLAFSDGIITLAVAAAVIFFAFGGYTEALIPLYAVGVFLAFTLSQLGMVVHWRRRRGAHWRKRLAVNGIGAALSAVVLVTAAGSKFVEGAWVVVVTVPLLVVLASRIRRHYERVDEALRLRPSAASAPDRVPVYPESAPDTAGDAAAGGDRRGEPPGTGPVPDDQAEAVPAEPPTGVRHLLVVPVARFNLASLRTLAYAASLGPPAFAVHLSPEEEEARRFREEWSAWGDHLPLEVVVTPYRAVIAPLAHYLEALHAQRPDVMLTVIITELRTRHRWHRVLHNRAEQRLSRALRPLPGVVVTSVPIHLPD